MTQPLSITPTPHEVWVSGDASKIVVEMLVAIGEEHNLDVWLNGQKIHAAVIKEEEDDNPKS